MDVVHLTIMKTFHNCLIASLLSPTHLHGMKRQINMCIFVIEFHYLIEFNSTKLLKELNWIWLNPIKFNLIEISTKTLTVLNPKEKNIVFSSINFNLWISFNVFEFNSNAIELRWIKLYYANSSISLCNLNITFKKSSKRNQNGLCWNLRLVIRVIIFWRILVSFKGFFEGYIFAWWNYIWVSIILLFVLRYIFM
jgi:hypothetical protein